MSAHIYKQTYYKCICSAVHEQHVKAWEFKSVGKWAVPQLLKISRYVCLSESVFKCRGAAISSYTLFHIRYMYTCKTVHI